MSLLSKAFHKNTGSVAGTAINPFSGITSIAGADNNPQRISQGIHNNSGTLGGTAVNPLNGFTALAGGTNNPGSGSGQSGSPGGAPGDVSTYDEVYNRDASQNDPNRGVYAWGDDANRTYQLAYNSFRSMFNRAPTQNEFAQVMGAFQGPNSAINGRAYLAQLQNQYKSNPGLDPTSTQNTMKPADVSGSVQQQFQSILGRAPTSDELQHFTQAIQTNQTDSYGLGSFLKQMPEYTNAQDSKFRSGLNTELQNYDTQEFDREKGSVISAYGKNGMAPGTSPSLDYALTDLMGKIASNRSAYLANLSSAQYGGNKDLAIGNYQNTLNQMNNNNQQMRQSQMGYGQQLINQGFQGADYGQGMKDYMNYQNSQRNQPLNSRDWQTIGAGVGGTAVQGAFRYLNS